MYLFRRTARLRTGTVRDGMSWAVSITEKVNQVTSLDVGLWQAAYSPGLGTLYWTAAVPDMTALEEATAKLTVDEGYLNLVETGAQFVDGGADDHVAQFIHNGIADGAPKANYAAVVRTTLQNGGFAKGIEAGVEIAMRATAAGGLPTSFLVATTGTYGEVAWITGASSMAELERSEQAVNAEPSFVQFIDEVSPACYVSGVTTQMIASRII